MRADHPILIKLIEAYLYEPIKVRHIIKASPNPDYIYRLAKSLMPYRVGIEIDSVGYPLTIDKRINELSILYKHDKKKGRLDSIPVLEFKRDGNIISSACEETRFSFSTYPGLLRFKTAVDYFVEKKIAVSEQGGMHIHIDLNMNIEEARKKEVAERIQPYYRFLRNRVCKNKKEDIAKTERIVYGERAKISVSRSFKTIEYRMSDPTYNYTEIMRQVLCFQQVNKVARNYGELNIELLNTILEL